MTTDKTSGEWMPIESAPKDGTLIVVAAEGDRHEMRWGTIQQNGLMPGVTGMWVHPSGAYTWDESRGYGPTHWMPLPSPPLSNKDNTDATE